MKSSEAADCIDLAQSGTCTGKINCDKINNCACTYGTSGPAPTAVKPYSGFTAVSCSPIGMERIPIPKRQLTVSLLFLALSFCLTGPTAADAISDAATVMWFGTKDSPDKVMDWYQEKLSGWSEITANGSRVTYKGTGGVEAKDIPTRSYIFTRITDETPGSTDSEITVRIPKS